jgi:hypothetical protein
MTVNEIRAMVGLPAIQETNETPAQ